MKKIIITVIGPDKPGIIASVSDLLFSKDCNVENISQTILQSQFAAICVVSIPETLPLEDLELSLNDELGKRDLLVHIKALQEEGPVTGQPETEPFIISTFGPDRKGLVASISRIIAGEDVNISNLKAVFEGGDNPDRNIMIFEVDVPVATDLQRLTDTLKNKATELALDLTIQHKNIFDAVNRI
jgi:glycine cleavage system transcriptional repressor